MNPILLRRSFYFISSAVTYLGVMGRYMVTRDWTAFEILPLFMPVWIVGALLAAEGDERYAFLRTLPVPDVEIARAKFTLILASTAFQWAVMILVAAGRMEEGISAPATVVYLSFVCAAGLLVGAGFQVAVWKYGISTMRPVLVVAIIAGIALAIVHLVNLKRIETWPALSQLGLLEWLGRAPWISSAAIAALTLVAFRSLFRLGVRVKVTSEAHL